MLQVPETLYVLKYNPANRREKRIAQKEYAKIQKALLPIVFAYLQEENKTDALRLRAKEEYIKWIPKANSGNKFVLADPDFFNKHFPTKQRVKELITPPKKAINSGYIIAGIITLLVTYFLLSLFFA